MSSENIQSVRGGGVGILGLLGVLFIGLKLGGVISWSWWLVLLPLYGPVVFALVIVLGVLGFFVLIATFQAVFAAAIYRKIS